MGRHRTQRFCGRQATRHCDRSTADEALLPAIAWSKGEATRGFLCTWTASLIVPGQHGTRKVKNPITDLVSSTTRSRQQDSRFIGAMLPASGTLTVPVSPRSPLAEHASPSPRQCVTRTLVDEVMRRAYLHRACCCVTVGSGTTVVQEHVLPLNVNDTSVRVCVALQLLKYQPRSASHRRRHTRTMVRTRV